MTDHTDDLADAVALRVFGVLAACAVGVLLGLALVRWVNP